MRPRLQPVLGIWFSAESILLVLHQDHEVAHLAGVYLRWLAPGLPAFAFNNVTRYNEPLFSSSSKPDFYNSSLTCEDVIFNLKVEHQIIPSRSPVEVELT